MLQELAARRPESLGEVSDLMVYASRRLGAGQTNKPVQQKQARAIELLNKLIKKAEDEENQQSKDNSGGGSQSRRSGQPNGNGSSDKPAEISRLPAGKGRIGELHRSAAARPGDEWGKMPPEERERDPSIAAPKLPSQYRQLVEQYYKQLAKEH